MKKVSALLLTTMLGSSMVFASFSGSANIDFGYDMDAKTYGFVNETSVNYDIDLVKQVNDATTSEEAIYAEINATLQVRVVDADEDGVDESDPDSTGIIGVGTSIDSAKIYGDNWSVDITGVDGSPDFAVSALDSEEVNNDTDDWGYKLEDYDDYYSYSANFQDDAPGFDAMYDFFNFGMGLQGDEDNADFLVYAGVSDYALSDSLTLSALAEYTQVKYTGDATVYGASAEVAYASDDYSATIATDMGYDADAEEFDMDVAANASYMFVTMDGYYATKATADKGDYDQTDATEDDFLVEDNPIEDLLSIQFVTDLNAFDMPLTVTLLGQDLINDQYLEAGFEYMASEKLTLTLTTGYTLDGADADDWSVELEAEYMMDTLGTIDATVTLKNDSVIAMEASIENTTMIDNATLSLTWEDATDLFDQANGQAFGSVTASCEIDF
jgi:hypothetical protein